MTTTQIIKEQMMDEIDLFDAQDLADRTGKTVYATALFDGHERVMLTTPRLTTQRPTTASRGEILQAVMIVTRPGQ